MARKFKTPITLDELGSASSQAIAANVDGDSQNRINIDAGGKITWGSGSATGDTTLYRSAADTLKTDDAFTATSLAVTGQFTLPTSDGSSSQVLQTNGSGTISWADITAYATVSDTAPGSPAAGQIWYESDTGKTFVYYDSYWIEVGASPPASPFITDLDEDTKIQVEESADEDKIRFDTAGSERMIIDASGKVGIGTATPSQVLDVSGNIALTGEIDGPSDFTVSNGQGEGIEFNQTANATYLKTLGTTRMAIDSSGNVGIGTTSPAEVLEISDPTRAFVIVDDTGGTVGTETFAKVEYRAGGTYAGHVGFNNTTTGILGLVNDNGEVRLQTNSADQILLRTNNSTRVTVSGTGNVGIGATSPGSDLHISSSAAELQLQDSDGVLGGSMTARLRMTDGSGNIHGTVGFSATSSGTMIVDNNDGPLLLRTLSADDIVFYTNTVERMRVDESDGAVKVTDKFFITGLSTIVVDVTNGTYPKIGNYSSSNDNLEVGSLGGIDFVIDSNGNTSEVFNWRSGGSAGAGTVLMTLDESGNLSALNKLSAGTGGIDSNGRVAVSGYGSFVRAGGSGNTLVVQNSSPVGSGVVRGIQVELGPDGNEDYTDSGDDFIRFITSNNQEIGGIRGTGGASVSYGTSSDYRLKAPIEEISDGLSLVRNIVPMYGKWLNQNDPDRIYSYFIAHELQEHVPDAVSGSKDEVDENGDPEYQSVDYGKLTPVLTAAIKDLDALVQTLTARIEALEAG